MLLKTYFYVFSHSSYSVERRNARLKTLFYVFTHLQRREGRIFWNRMKDALLKEAKTKLLDLIKIRGEVSVDEATLELGLAKTTVRQHLLLLERQGLLTRGGRKTAKGRPQLIYRLSNRATQLFPTQEPELLRQLLTRLIADGQNEWVNNFFREYWAQRTRKFRERLEARGKLTPKATRKVLFELLEEEGFMPEISEQKGTVSVRECNCPFPEAVKATRIPCRLEAEFLREALETNFERVSYIPSGSTTCTYVAAAKAPKKKTRLR